MTKPIIFEYLDAPQFLSDILKWKKEIEPSFSISKWAEQMKFGSKVTLRFILKKQRRISPDTMQALKTSLQLNDDESKYFENLVAFSQAKTSTEKQAIGATLIKLQHGQFKQKVLPSETAARHIYTPVILTLLTFNDIENNRQNIAKILAIDEESVQRVLSDLEKDGLVEQRSDRTYHFAEKKFRVFDNINLKGFYEYWIDKSKAALELPYEQRRYRALKFALTLEEFNEVVERMNEYSLVLLSKFQSSSFQGRRLYMYESAVFPISQPADEVSN